MAKKKKLIRETNFFEVEVHKNIDLGLFLSVEYDMVRLLSFMPVKERNTFFDYYDGCEKFKIIGNTSLGPKGIIEVEFWYEDSDDV